MVRVPSQPLSAAALALLAELAPHVAPVDTQTVADLRARSSLVRPTGSSSTGISSTDHTVRGADRDVPVRVYRPVDGRGVLVYFHGGGFVLGGLDASDRTCTRLAGDLGWTIVSVDYPLAPEHPFPASVDAGDAVLRWAADHLPSLADTPRLGIVGDSAGGGLAAAVAAAAGDGASVALDVQLLLYPVLCCRTEADTYPGDRDTVLLTAAAMAWYARQYLGGSADADDPRASPLLAPDRQLARFPPTLIATVGHDPLALDGDGYAARLRAAGVMVLHVHHPGGFHGYYSFADVLGEAGAAWREIVDRFRELVE
jgi:acetyl esterase